MFKSLFGFGEKKKPNPIKRIVKAQTPSGEQLRDSFRVEIPPNAPPIFLRFTYKKRNFRWKVLNISVGGVLIEGKYSNGFFGKEDLLTDANIIVPKNKLDIEFSGGFELSIQRLVIADTNSIEATYTLGCSFKKISHANEKNLDKYVRMLQLQYAKTEAKSV